MRISGLLLVSLIAAVPVAAQDVAGWAGAQVGFLNQKDDNRGAKDTAMFGVTGGAWFTKRLGADASFQTANIESSRGKGSGSQQYMTVAALFNFLPEDKLWTIYAKAGVGSVRVEPPWAPSSTNKSITLLGLGTQYRIGVAGMAGVELQMVRFNADYHEWPILFTAGWRFGGAAKPIKKK
jgi:opacity protein-like surface antigen